MRRAIGTLLVGASMILLHEFSTWGTFLSAPRQAVSPSLLPFHALGENYPYDAGLLIGAAWALGLGLTFLLSPGQSKSISPLSVPSASRWAQRVTSEHGAFSWMATSFLLNALLLISTLFIAYVGANASRDHIRMVSVCALMALFHVAIGLILLIFAFFERPRGIVKLTLGGAVYLVGTIIVITVFAMGIPGS